MNKLKVFENQEFGTIRTVEIDGEPWLVGKDVAMALGYSNASKAVMDHIDNEDKCFEMLSVSDSQNGNLVKTALINESGLYSLILSSKLPSAKQFKRWIFNSILNSNKRNEEIMKNNQSNTIQVFDNPEFGKIRTLTENGKTLFCGKDVAAALGYNEPHKAISRHCKGGTKRPIGVQTGIKADGSPATQQIEMIFIPEGDIYRLAVRSDLPGAEKFESWIFDEVLPSIRKTGMYTMPQDYISALRAYADECERNMLLEGQVKEKEAQITVMTPKVNYHDRVLDTENLYTTTVIAKEFGKTAAWMNDYLYDKGVQFKQSGKWILYQKYADKGYTGYATVLYKDSSGTEHSKMYMKWTQSGRQFIHKLMDEDGYFPIKNLDKNYDDLY